LSDEEIRAEGLRERLSTAGEEALGEITQALLDNPLFNQALVAAVGAGERALAAQRSAMSALSIPSASDLERLERRLRSVSNRLEAVEDRLDEIEDAAASRKAPARSLNPDSERDQDGVTTSELDS
jgi:hypothetical protein